MEEKMIENVWDKVGEFLEKLTQLSREYQIGISGEPPLFRMEYEQGYGDLTRSYRCNEEGRLEFI